MTGWAGVNWKNGVLINGKRYQRVKALRDLDKDYDYVEDLYNTLC